MQWIDNCISKASFPPVVKLIHHCFHCSLEQLTSTNFYSFSLGILYGLCHIKNRHWANALSTSFVLSLLLTYRWLCKYLGTCSNIIVFPETYLVRPKGSVAKLTLSNFIKLNRLTTQHKQATLG